MEAIKHKMNHPLDALKQMIRCLIDHCNTFDKKGLIVAVDGTLNSAICAHIANEATINGTLNKLILMRALDTTQHAQDITTAYPAASIEVVDLGMMGPLTRARASQALSNGFAQASQGLVIGTGDLTEYFVGPAIPIADEYPLIKFLLKSELEKLAKTVIDWNNANLEKQFADPRNTSIDNPMAAQENPSNTDFALCTILAAKDTQCELLLGSYKEHQISEGFKKTKLLRNIEKFDYNTIRAAVMCDEL